MDSLYLFFVHEAHAKNLAFKYENGLPYGKCNLITDKIKLEQVLTNLIKNAIKFTKNGEISYGYKPNKNTLLFWVKDTGVGIDKKNHQSIFERFRQAEISTSAEHGSGLGLAISRAFVESMQGEMWVESEPGQGSTFYFSLPFIQTRSA
ncbi:MAG: hypothetical protein GVY19_06120 [Bacteroidetes bacterium]|jgi:signal transduction histidine kinase|nr:hypothetical protein [Bacteroidota bacterium]